MIPLLEANFVFGTPHTHGQTCVSAAADMEPTTAEKKPNIKSKAPEGATSCPLDVAMHLATNKFPLYFANLYATPGECGELKYSKLDPDLLQDTVLTVDSVVLKTCMARKPSKDYVQYTIAGTVHKGQDKGKLVDMILQGNCLLYYYNTPATDAFAASVVPEEQSSPSDTGNYFVFACLHFYKRTVVSFN